ncbi:MAG: 6-phosphogluconolactonase, partial [Steroidobacteraceae bacterium]
MADTKTDTTRSDTAAGPQVLARRFPDREALLAALDARLEEALAGAERAAPESQRAHAVMLSGGSTPMPAYRALAERGVRPARDLYLLFSDDRYVPSTSEASNYHQARPLIDALALPADRVLRVRTELPLAAAAEDYERRLAELDRRGVRLELGLLGLGADGHTASLFRIDDVNRAQGRRALPVHRPDGRDAVSVSPAVLAQFARLVFIVAGTDKRAALSALLARDPALTAYRAVSGRAEVEVWT